MYNSEYNYLRSYKIHIITIKMEVIKDVPTKIRKNCLEFFIGTQALCILVKKIKKIKIFIKGSFYNDKLNGKGLLVFDDGSYLYSTFSENLLDGSGILHFRNGDILIGQWHNNLMNGIAFIFKKEQMGWYLINYKKDKFEKIILFERINDFTKIPKSFKNYQALLCLSQINCFEKLFLDLQQKIPYQVK